MLFVFGFIILNSGLNLMFKRYGKANYAIVKKDRRFWREYNGQPILICGNSRPESAITDTHNNVIKFCSYGETIELTHGKLESVFSTGKQLPKLVIIPIGYPYIGLSIRSSSQFPFYWSKYVSYMELARESGYFKEYIKASVHAKLFPYSGYIKNRIENKFKPRLEGFQNMSEQEKSDLAKQVVQKQDNAISYFNPIAIKYLNRIAGLCEKHNVDIVFISYPTTHYYREFVGSKSDKISALITQLKNNFEISIEHYDFSSAFDNCPECFKDVHHVNKHGATIFTKMLMDKCIPKTYLE